MQFKKENQEDLEMIIMDSGADDYEIIDDYINIYVNPSNFDSVKSKLEEAGYSNFETAEITFVSSDKVKLEKEDMDQFLATLERFEDNDDVQEVYHNVDLSTLE